MKILVTGATGYVGGRLVPRLLERGHDVRVLVRDERRIEGRPWADRVEVRIGDLLEPETIDGIAETIDVSCYLVRSLCAGESFEDCDRAAAENFVRATRGLSRVVYLGGLVPSSRVSTRFRGRGEVGEILRGALPTLELRAGPILGSGSASFELVRYLTERLPAMIAPKWIENLIQPIGVRNALEYLMAAVECDETGVVEIGADPLTFKELMEIYAAVRGLRRWIVPVPMLTPRLAGLWVQLVTPIPKRLALPFIEGVVSSVVADTRRARELFPEIDPMSCRAAVELALERVMEGETETRWSGALGDHDDSTYEVEDREGLVREIRTRHVDASPTNVYRVFTGIGGDRGWLVWDFLWEVRGLMDRVVGGPGIRRGRRDPDDLYAGEALDFWRVEEIEPDHLLRLHAEMKVPGRAWLQWEVVPEGSGSRLVQTATFAPEGLLGALYWYSLYAIHKFIFSDLIDEIRRRAELGIH